MNGMPGVNSTADVNVHTLALQIPVNRAHPVRANGPERPGRRDRRVDDGQPPAGPGVGQLVQRRRHLERPVDPGVTPRQPARQRAPHRHRRQGRLEHAAADGGRLGVPELLHRAAAAAAAAEPVPGVVFPNLATYNGGPPNTRPDIEAIFLTGIPAGVITQAPTFTNYNGTGVKADMLRLNTAIPPSLEPQQPGPPGPRRGRVAQRPEGVRRRRHHRAACGRRGDAGLRDEAEVHRRRGGGSGRLRAHDRWHGHRPLGKGHRELPRRVPVPGNALQRVLEPVRDAGRRYAP